MLYMSSAIFFLEQYIPDKFYIQRYLWWINEYKRIWAEAMAIQWQPCLT
jgi:hypothetical protein